MSDCAEMFAFKIWIICGRDLDLFWFALVFFSCVYSLSALMYSQCV